MAKDEVVVYMLASRVVIRSGSLCVVRPTLADVGRVYAIQSSNISIDQQTTVSPLALYLSLHSVIVEISYIEYLPSQLVPPQ